MSYRLLVVDDEPNLLRAIAACFYGDDYDVITARSAEQALIRMAEAVPDVIISDIRMPGTDGYGLLRHLRASPRTSLVPIVFLSAKDQSADRIAGFRAGVDAYLTKPFEPDELLAIIGSILARVRRTHTEIARLVGPTAAGMSSHHEDLTPGEVRVAASVARGCLFRNGHACPYTGLRHFGPVVTDGRLERTVGRRSSAASASWQLTGVQPSGVVLTCVSGHRFCRTTSPSRARNLLRQIAG